MPVLYGARKMLAGCTHKSSLKCYSGQTDLLLHIVELCAELLQSRFGSAEFAFLGVVVIRSVV